MNKLEGENLTRKGAGRPKGSQNRVSKEAKEVIAEAAERLGGADRLLAWVQESPDNEKAYWTSIYPKLIAVSIAGNVTARLIVETGVERAED